MTGAADAVAVKDTAAAILRAVADGLDERATAEAGALTRCRGSAREHEITHAARLGLLLELVADLRTQAIQREQS